MDLDYSGKHTINFYKSIDGTTYKRNSWKDFHLVPEKRPSIKYPEPNLMFVTLPGTSKRLDITDYHTGGLTFGARTGSWTFYIEHENFAEWPIAPTLIKNFLNGRQMYVSLSDEPSLYYSGVLYVGDYKPGESFSEITINYELAYDTFVRTEKDLGGGTVSLLDYSPIKFIGDNGFAYANDYGITAGTTYISELSDGSNKLTAYDLITINAG